ncbi:hypothetical protein LSAT2_028110 [Lamellibrachia satsuma]|nr:hypothetical protein LSAT2_028110 [Lamellibrachia satsuma]
MFVCILILGAAATQQAPTDGGTQGDLCAQRGGLCQSTNECDQTTNVFVGFCSEAIVCCVPKRFVCEKMRSATRQRYRQDAPNVHPNKPDCVVVRPGSYNH